MALWVGGLTRWEGTHDIDLSGFDSDSEAVRHHINSSHWLKVMGLAVVVCKRLGGPRVWRRRHRHSFWPALSAWLCGWEQAEGNASPRVSTPAEAMMAPQGQVRGLAGSDAAATADDGGGGGKKKKKEEEALWAGALICTAGDREDCGPAPIPSPM